jgi:hypothetical protein
VRVFAAPIRSFRVSSIDFSLTSRRKTYRFIKRCRFYTSGDTLGAKPEREEHEMAMTKKIAMVSWSLRAGFVFLFCVVSE